MRLLSAAASMAAVIIYGANGFKLPFSNPKLREQKALLSPTAMCASSSSTSSSPSVSDLRKEYSSKGIDADEMPEDPYIVFQEWFEEACSAKVLEPNAMCLSTCKENKPTARFVLLKGHDSRGYVWYTNYNSRKSQDLLENPQAALTFWWGDLERSIRIEGAVEKVSEEESTTYFSSRPRGSQIGAWTSNQSSEIESRAALQEQEEDIMTKFESLETIPKPPHWGGFRLIPLRVEFWKGRESRLHDRVLYERSEATSSKWSAPVRLQP